MSEVRNRGLVRVGGITQMRTLKETIGTAAAIGGVCVVLLLVVILSVLIVLVEALFEKLMSLITLLREKMMTLYAWTVRTCNRSAIVVTTPSLRKSVENVGVMINNLRNKLGI